MSANARTTSDDGASAVEFALILPVLLILVFGIIDFGWAFGQTLQLRSAVREAARTAVVNDTPDPKAMVRSRADHLKTSDIQVSVQFDDTNGNSVLGDAGDTLVICADYPLSPLSGLGDVLYPFPNAFDTKSVMRMEQVARFGPSTTAGWSGTCSP